MTSSSMRTFSLVLFTALSGCASGSYLWYRLAPDYPTDESETFALAGLGAEVIVHLDAQGVPHIRAESERDLLRAIGFVQGRDRFFQMDVMRRLAQGRLSELVGEQPFVTGTTAELDLAMRGWRMGELADADVAGMTADDRALLAAFTDGVNAALERWRPIEYRLLGVTPEPWRPLDTMALGRLNAWSVSHNWSQEISRFLLALWGGVDRADAIYPGVPWSSVTSLPPEEGGRPLGEPFAAALRELLPARPPPPPGPAVGAGVEALAGHASDGSNAWVIGGARTKSGQPLLAGDPHLSLMLPSILYQMHIAAPGLDAIGLTMPGLPYLIAGHNHQVAWSPTSSVADVMDLCVEKPDPDDPTRVATPTGWQELSRETVTILVRRDGELEQRAYTLRRSRNGPLFGDMYPGLLPEWAPPLALRTSADSASGSLAALGRMNRAKDLEALRAAAAELVTAINVFQVADRSGTIGMLLNGQMPRRERWRGTFPIPGWLAEYDWQGTVAGLEMPAFFGGAEDRFAHANNLLRDPEQAKVVVAIDTAPSYRFDRITALLDARRDHDHESVRAIQTDRHLGRAARLVPALLADLAGLAAPSPAEQAARAALAAWDFDGTAEGPAAAVFFVTYREAARLALEDELTPRLTAFFLSQRYATSPIDDWLANADNPVWDDRRSEAVETRADIVRAAFRRAVGWLGEHHGADPAGWRWGTLHAYRLRHLFGGREALAALFNLPEAPAFGGPDSIWKEHLDLGHAEHPFAPMAGPSARWLIDLGDPHHGAWVSSTGASGWPGSPHYGDQYPLWLRGELVPMLSDWAELERTAAGTLRLR